MKTGALERTYNSAQMDENTFQTLFEKYYLPLEYYAAKFVGTASAPDIVHDIFHKLIEKDHIDIYQNIEGYLFRMVRNRALNELKSRKEDLFDHYPKDIAIQEIEYFDQHESLLQTEANDIIFAAIDELPPRMREVFIKSKLDGMKNIEIAEELNISVKTVEKNMTKAYKALREQLKDYQYSMLICSPIGINIVCSMFE